MVLLLLCKFQEQFSAPLFTDVCFNANSQVDLTFILRFVVFNSVIYFINVVSLNECNGRLRIRDYSDIPLFTHYSTSYVDIERKIFISNGSTLEAF